MQAREGAARQSTDANRFETVGDILLPHLPLKAWAQAGVFDKSLGFVVSAPSHTRQTRRTAAEIQIGVHQLQKRRRQSARIMRIGFGAPFLICLSVAAGCTSAVSTMEETASSLNSGVLTVGDGTMSYADASTGASDGATPSATDASETAGMTVEGQADGAAETAEALAVAPPTPVSPALAAANAAMTDQNAPTTEIAAAGETDGSTIEQDDENAQVAVAEPAPQKQAKEPTFFGRLFSNKSDKPRTRTLNTKAGTTVSPRTSSILSNPSPRAQKQDRRLITANRSGSGDGLPGVRAQSLFEIQTRTGLNDSTEDTYQLASAAGLARLTPNGLIKQRESVQTACLKPELLRLLKTVEYHYRRPIIVTSGYRSPKYNRRVGGARHSKHMTCEAADIQIEGVGKHQLASYLRSLPGRGGVGTYCSTKSVHIDIGKVRDWNWRCRRRK